MRLRGAVIFVWLSFAVACGGRTLGAPRGDAGNGNTGTDSAVAVDAAVPPDASDPCACSMGEVYRDHACVVTTELGCGRPCNEDGTGCPEQQRCEPCAASSGCGDDDCRPACVYEFKRVIEPGDLRIHPTSGPAGQETEVTLVGQPWIVAALWYDVYFGYPSAGEALARELSSDSYACTHRVLAPAREAGTVPVFVSQYGGEWPVVLAGYFTYTAPQDPAPQCTQPGYPCADFSDCCAWFPMLMGCDRGWCEYIGDNPVP